MAVLLLSKETDFSARQC